MIATSAVVRPVALSRAVRSRAAAKPARSVRARAAEAGEKDMLRWADRRMGSFSENLAQEPLWAACSLADPCRRP